MSTTLAGDLRHIRQRQAISAATMVRLIGAPARPNDWWHKRTSQAPDKVLA